MDNLSRTETQKTHKEMKSWLDIQLGMHPVGLRVLAVVVLLAAEAALDVLLTKSVPAESDIDSKCSSSSSVLSQSSSELSLHHETQQIQSQSLPPIDNRNGNTETGWTFRSPPRGHDSAFCIRSMSIITAQYTGDASSKHPHPSLLCAKPARLGRMGRIHNWR